jgi:hypothetical protein
LKLENIAELWCAKYCLPSWHLERPLIELLQRTTKQNDASQMAQEMNHWLQIIITNAENIKPGISKLNLEAVENIKHAVQQASKALKKR